MDALAPTRELSALIRGGELRQAGEWLVARHARDVIGLCRSMVRERELAEDLAQDVFAQAFTSLRGYRGEAAPRTWLLSIARNRCIDHLRRAQREPWDDSGEGAEPDLFADDAPLPAELLLRRSDVDAALGELAEGERALVVLRFRLGLEYPELATVFGLREGTVRMRLSRALGKMRERLELREEVPALARAEAAPEAFAALEEEATPTGRARAPEAVAGARATRPALGGPPMGGAPPPQSAAPLPPPPPMPRPAGSAATPPPASAVAPSRAAPLPMTRAGKGGGLLERLRGFFSGAPEQLSAAEARAPATPFAAALAESEPEPSESFVQTLERLLSQLPD